MTSVTIPNSVITIGVGAFKDCIGLTEVAITINHLFNWDKPYGQWMNQHLKDIDAAKKAGDTERYNSITERYSTWAENYPRRDDPPSLDRTPGR
jgi:hypothetical protein